MLTVIIQNEYGESLDISHSNKYDLLQVTGLTPPIASLNFANSASGDGGKLISKKLEPRNITMLIAPTFQIEDERNELYRFLSPKHEIRLRFITASKDVFIDGVVESLEGDLYENPQKLQASIICGDPYFKSVENELIQFSSVISQFEFVWEPTEEGQVISEFEKYTRLNIDNPSTDKVGIVLELLARGTVLEPTIWNESTNEKIIIAYEMQEGDKIVLNTKKGEKSLKLIRDGIETNIINCLEEDSDWISLKSGDNIISYSCAFGMENLFLTIDLQSIHQGV